MKDKTLSLGSTWHWVKYFYSPRHKHWEPKSLRSYWLRRRNFSSFIGSISYIWRVRNATCSI